eukprot:434268_1
MVRSKIKLSRKYIHIYFVFMELINHQHQPTDLPSAPKIGDNLSPFRHQWLHINTNRSCNTPFWIGDCGGNQHQWTNVSLTAEVRTPEKIPVEQEQKVYFAKIAGFEQSLGIREAVCNAKNGIKRGFQHLTISGNSGLKMMENMDMDFNIKFEEQDLQL